MGIFKKNIIYVSTLMVKENIMEKPAHLDSRCIVYPKLKKAISLMTYVRNV